MKRRLLSFVMLFVVTFCFVSGCKDDGNEQSVLVADGKEVIATINGVNYTADDVYGDLINSSSNAEYIYEQLEDLLIKTVVPVTESMRSRIVNEVERWKKDIKENATINGKSYKAELATALQEEGVNSEEELIEKKIFSLQEEIITNQYWNNSKNNYYEDYINNRYVYDISQILVSVGTNGNYDYFDVEPSSTVAKKIYDVINALISGESFYNVALRYSDDAESGDNGGDLGMVTLSDTSIPDEVKYALASYSIYEENAELNHPEYLDSVYKNGVEAIPQKYVDILGEVYNDDTKYLSSSSSTTLYARVYGRNVIFNNLFNTRTYRYLQSDGDKNVTLKSNVKMPLKDVVGYETQSAQNVIVNEQGNPILVVRSNSGIHFISIRKTAFVGTEELKKYYSTEIDLTDGYETYLERVISMAEDEDTAKSVTIEALEGLAKEYAIMKVSDNSSFAGNEEFIRYDMFNYYLNGTYNGVKFEIVNENVEKIISQFISAKKEYVQTKMNNAFSEKYELYANSAEYADTDLIKKQTPILSCLEKDTDGKYKCTYTYKDGFVVYNAATGGAE